MFLRFSVVVRHGENGEHGEHGEKFIPQNKVDALLGIGRSFLILTLSLNGLVAKLLNEVNNGVVQIG